MLYDDKRIVRDKKIYFNIFILDSQLKDYYTDEYNAILAPEHMLYDDKMYMANMCLLFGLDDMEGLTILRC